MHDASSLPSPPILTSSRTTHTERRHRRRLFLEVRQSPSARRRCCATAASVVIGLLLSSLVLMASGVPAADLAQEFVLQALFDRQGLLSVIAVAAPLMMVGLAASLAFSVRFWNLGIEGQLITGAIAGTAVSLWNLGPAGPSRLFIMAAVAAIAGLAWIAVAWCLQRRWQVSEIISTLMLNYLAALFLSHLLFGAWVNPEDGMPHTASYRAFERLPTWSVGIGAAAPLALALTVLAGWLLARTRFGFEVRVVHANENVARLAGIAVTRTRLALVLASGAIAGLAGLLICAGSEGRLTQGFYGGYGFSGVLIAFLARNRPMASGVVAVLVAVLFIGMQSLQVFYQIPFATAQLVQALLVLCVAASDFFVRHRVRLA
jgi:general nucleoside transport system permease protein